MTQTASPDLASLPLPPKIALPYRQRARTLRSFHGGMDELRDAGGPVTGFRLGPGWLMPPIAALHRLAGDILAKCRADPSTDAPLVQALIAATDSVTGNGLPTARLPTN